MTTKDDIDNAIAGKNFVLAAALAREQGLLPHEIREIQRNALWQMAAVHRNSVGTKQLALQFNLSKDQVRELLENQAGKVNDGDSEKALKARYDYTIDRHVDFQEWLKRLLNKWNTLPDA